MGPAARPFTFSLCADDYAMTPSVSRGIVEALDAGALAATSVMTTSLWWPETAGALNPYKGRVDLGLHLNLTLGAPLGPMPILAPGGQLPTIGALIRMVRRGALPVAEVADEIDRQAERFVAVFGRPPDHVDGHQHVQALSPIRPLLFAMLRRRGWRSWLRDSGDSLGRILMRGTQVRKALVVAALSRGFPREAKRQGFETNKGFAGFSSFDSAADYASAFERYMRAPGPRHLVMCHPGYVDDALRSLDPVVETRETELSFLTSRRFADMLDRRRATLKRLTSNGVAAL